jgi:membrane associated rhomboid family serine protease
MPQAPSMPTCYRHPHQVAGVICQRCDRPICPQCMNVASVGFHCPECVKQGSQKVYRGPAALAQAAPVVTQVLIGLNVLAFVIGLIDSRGKSLWTAAGGFETNGGLFGPAVVHHPWILITSGFLHAGLVHIGLNMWSLYILGRVLEPIVGRLRFALLYFAAMLAGSLGALLLTPRDLSVGASGAIFGLLGALLVVAQRNHAVQALRQLLFWLGVNFAITLTIPAISKGDHFGGVIGGAAACFAMLEVQERTRSKQAAVAVVCAIGLACAVIAYVLMRSKYGADPLYQL